MSRRTLKRLNRGYTLVELMMALGVFASGVVGIISMQRATVNSNQLAKNVTLASGIAQAWQSQLSADATLWTSANNVTSTTWLTSITVLDNQWQLPTYNAVRAFGPAFDAFGNPVSANGTFCAQIRLTWLYGDKSAQQNTGLAGNGLIRTEVRVFWPRDGVTPINNDCGDASQATVNAIGAATGTYHFVLLAGAVHQPGAY